MQLQRFDDPEQGFAVTAVKFLDEGLIAVSVMGAHLLALLQEQSYPSLSMEDLANLCATLCLVFGISAGLYHVGEHFDQVFRQDPFLLTQSFQLLLSLLAYLCA